MLRIGVRGSQNHRTRAVWGRTTLRPVLAHLHRGGSGLPVVRAEQRPEDR